MCQENQEKSETNEDEDLKYKTYIEERKSLLDAKLEGSRLFDKAILTLAAGSFALSLTFIKQIIQSTIHNHWILILAWICFGVSILSTLVSFLVSQEGCSRQIEILEQTFFANEKSKNKLINIPGVWTRRLNWLSIISFITGVLFLTLFVVINFTTNIGGKTAMSNKEKFNEGFVPQAPPIKPGKLPDAGYVPPKTPIKPPIKPPKDGK
jgi:hypothetical protein